jgi:hypothetical protein
VTFGHEPHSKADSKWILTWAVGGRDAGYALALMDDLRSRITNRVQLTAMGIARICRLSRKLSEPTLTT